MRLLPYFDAYVVGGQPRELLYPGLAARRALSGGQAGNFQVLLIDGIVSSIWHQRRSGRKIDITVEPFISLTSSQHSELEDQVERIGTFFDVRAHMTIGPVTTGGHA